MKTIALIPCVKEKLMHPATAEEMYISPFFQKNLSYVRSIKADMIFVLSGKYGLLSLDQKIDPYDVNLHDSSDAELKAWSNQVLDQLRQVADLGKDHFVILADAVYRKYLVPELAHVEFK